MDRSPKDLSQLVEDMTKGRSTAADREPLGDEERVCETHGPYIASGVRYFGTRTIWSRCPDCEEARKAAERRPRPIGAMQS